MMLARVACAGAIHAAQPQALADGRMGVRLTDGRTLAEEDVVWLPPLEVGTIIALGLNYAKRAKELAFTTPEEPLVFLKGPGTLIGQPPHVGAPLNGGCQDHARVTRPAGTA